MRKFLFLNILFAFSVISATAQILSFEQLEDISNWKATNGKISQSSDKVKLGDYSLRWDTEGGKTLTATNIQSLKAISTTRYGGIYLYVYNTKATTSTLHISFNYFQSARRSIDFQLNFVGWRALWARFNDDTEVHKSGSFNSMQFDITGDGEVPPTLYFDCIEFPEVCFWDRTPDLQCRYLANNEKGFLPSWDTPLPTVKTASTAEIEALKTIEKRVDNWFVGNGTHETNEYFQLRKDELSTFSKKVKIPAISPSGTVNKSGLFNARVASPLDGIQLNYFTSTNERVMHGLAVDYCVNGNNQRVDDFIKMLTWYKDQGWAPGSGLGTWNYDFLRDVYYYYAVYMMRDVIPANLKDDIRDTFKWYSGVLTRLKPNLAFTGLNSDEIRTKTLPSLQYILMEKDPDLKATMLHGYKEFLNKAFDYATGYSDAFKPDGTLYHHRGPYMSSYGNGALYYACLMWYLLYDTPFQLDEATYDRLKMLLLSFRFVCGNYAVSAGLTGRFPYMRSAEKLQELLPAFAYLALSSPTGKVDTDLQKAFLRLWKPDENPEFSFFSVVGGMEGTHTLGEIDAMISVVETNNNVSAEPNPTGSKYMPYAGLLVYRQPNWMLSFKGYSKYIWDYEEENYKNRYVGYGYAELTNFAKNNFTSFNENWDWQYLPGTTACTFKGDTRKRDRNMSDQSFLGGIGFNAHVAMFTNRLHDVYYNTTFYADKSYYVIDNVVYCMGSGIKCKATNGNTVSTTLFQNFNKVPYTDRKVIQWDKHTISDNIGNTYIIHSGQQYTFKKTSGNFSLAYIEHGANPTDAKYNYTWLIDNNLKESIDFYNNNSPFEVLEQSNTGHVVWNSQHNILFASVFKAGALSNAKFLKSVSKPMMTIIQDYGEQMEIAFSNPDMDRPSAPGETMSQIRGDDVYTPGRKSNLSFVIDGVYRKIEGDASVKVVYDLANNTTTISHSTVHDGETYRVKLAKGQTAIDSINEDLIYCYKINNGYQFLSHSPFVIILQDTNGRLVDQIESKDNSLIINDYSYTKGIYIANIIINKQTIIKKIIL